MGRGGVNALPFQEKYEEEYIMWIVYKYFFR